MIVRFQGKVPKIHKSAYISENVSVIGDVTIGEDSNIWFGTVIRGDICEINIGYRTNVQDNCTLHVGNEKQPLYIGNNVTIGHNAIVHGCTVEDEVLIGMGAIILNDAHIGKNTIIGAGALVSEGKEIPSGVLCLGVPAKVVRKLTEEEIESIKKSAENYVNLSKKYESK